MLIDTIRNDMVTAMKSKDKIHVELNRMIIAAVQKIEKDTCKPTDEIQQGQAVLKEIDQLKESLEAFQKAGRKKEVEMLKRKLEIAEKYKPALMGEEVIEVVISQVLAGLEIENPAPADKGKIMRELMPRVRGKADGKLVDRLVMARMNK